MESHNNNFDLQEELFGGNSPSYTSNSYAQVFLI